MTDNKKIQLRAYLDDAIIMEFAGTTSVPVNLSDKFVADYKEVGESFNKIVQACLKHGKDILGFRVLLPETEDGFFEGYKAYPMIYMGDFCRGTRGDYVTSNLMTPVKINPWDYVINSDGKCEYGAERLTDVYTLPSKEVITERMVLLKREKIKTYQKPHCPDQGHAREG